MKVYDRKTKRWITQEEHDRKYSKRDKDLCRGKRPHDWVLVLPSWIKTDQLYKGNPAIYYKERERMRKLEEESAQQLARYDIIVTPFNWPESKQYVCAVCRKHEYVRDGKTPR